MRRPATPASVTAHRPRDQFFYWLLSLDPSRFMRRYGIIPAVVGIQNQTGPMHVLGSARDLVLSDATMATEEILAANPPESVEYRLTNLTNAFRYLVREGNASFSFRERLRWTRPKLNGNTRLTHATGSRTLSCGYWSSRFGLASCAQHSIG